ncbi:helix-turn-helix transcriptional regulator [Kallipyga massiliensis]|uniref:helix-turn-helix transcriptional regulator n=1 Tax=Kallipyga massiliensis TaxID=1472764 RepID=UPI00056B80C1|nr:PAS domain-containing protein [Kallipyga massiliensis]
MNSIIESYFPVADMIAETFGKNCEAVVHDLTHPDSSVVYVANGHVTNRRPGQSFDHLVRQVLLNKNFQNDRTCNYVFELDDGRKIKSSSVLIRDEKKDVVGMLCVNYDITQLLSTEKYIENFLCIKQDQSDYPSDVEQDVMTVIDDLIMNIVGPRDIKNQSRKKNVEIVKFMDEKGIFLVKGAIDKVADLMGVSTVTIYSYLDEAKGKRG